MRDFYCPIPLQYVMFVFAIILRDISHNKLKNDKMAIIYYLAFISFTSLHKEPQMHQICMNRPQNWEKIWY